PSGAIWPARNGVAEIIRKKREPRPAVQGRGLGNPSVGFWANAKGGSAGRTDGRARGSPPNPLRSRYTTANVSPSPLSDQAMRRRRAPLRPSPLATSGLSVFVIISRCRPDSQLMQPSGQHFELLVCSKCLQAVNADLNRLGVGVGDTVDVFCVTH